MSKRVFGATFILTLAGLALGFWQVAALAGVVGGYLTRGPPRPAAAAGNLPSRLKSEFKAAFKTLFSLLLANLGTLAAWLLVLIVQLVATPAGRVVGAFGTALLGAAGLPVLVLASLLFALLLAALGALAGRSLKRVLAKEAS